MKLFTDKDVDTGGQFPRINCETSELVMSLLPWQKRGLQQTSTGYGAKLTSSFKINFNGKLRRLYHTCYGNASSCWFVTKGRKIFVN